MTLKLSTETAKVHAALPPGLKAKIDGLFGRIADEPEKMTKLRSRGVRQFDTPFLIDGTVYFAVVGFTVNKAKQSVTIKTLVTDEIHGLN